MKPGGEGGGKIILSSERVTKKRETPAQRDTKSKKTGGEKRIGDMSPDRWLRTGEPLVPHE